MKIRERFFNSVLKKDNDYMPYHMELCEKKISELQSLGIGDWENEFHIPYKFLMAQAYPRNVDFKKYFDKLKENTLITEFGVAYEPGSFEHFTHLRSPMENFTSLEEYKSYPYPDGNTGYDYDSFAKEVEKVKSEDKIAVAVMAITIFEIGWYMRGMENFLMDMYTQEDALRYHLERICEIRCAQAYNYAKSGVDVIHIGDDIATQQSMMFSLDMYRQWIKPYHKKVIESARKANPNVLIDYHSDGNCTTAIPDLIEIGVNILNPVQPECMDIKTIKKEFGKDLAFRGGVGTQTVMPFGTAADVKTCVRDLIKVAGFDGGLIVAPSHLIEPEVPIENVLAFMEVLNDYNNGKI